MYTGAARIRKPGNILHDKLKRGRPTGPACARICGQTRCHHSAAVEGPGHIYKRPPAFEKFETFCMMSSREDGMVIRVISVVFAACIICCLFSEWGTECAPLVSLSNQTRE